MHHRPFLGPDGSGRDGYVQNKDAIEKADWKQSLKFFDTLNSNQFYQHGFTQRKRKIEVSARVAHQHCSRALPHFPLLPRIEPDVKSGITPPSSPLKSSQDRSSSPMQEVLGPPISKVFEPRPPARQTVKKDLDIQPEFAAGKSLMLPSFQSPRSSNFKPSPMPPNVLKIGYAGHRPRHRKHQWQLSLATDSEQVLNQP
eukprot:NODE_5340_length_955_cov_55.981971_g5125_i0.p1 GENE.NODE_5340_length_955_cov_55.981971_g5125_i0~~NODE_5340_length_955_cov_55.981971_g5125_i0.p1  ORF type:complete len:199 (+),score=9.93 NODE_5340_length_955_cov_55.981971_g5125_i0:67-663(+)